MQLLWDSRHSNLNYANRNYESRLCGEVLLQCSFSSEVDVGRLETRAKCVSRNQIRQSVVRDSHDSP